MRVLVVGAGAIGLRTAQELRNRGIQAVVRAPVSPLVDSCSMGAGGLWMPFRCDDPRVDKWAIETLDELLEKRMHTEILPAVFFTQTPSSDLPSWTRDPRLHFNQEPLAEVPIVIPETLRIYSHAWTFQAPVIDSPRMLDEMLKDLKDEDLDVETGHYLQSIDEMKDLAVDLKCDAAINCSGLGAAKLRGDFSLTGARGILHHYDRSTCPQEALLMVDEAPIGSQEFPVYLIPRGDIVVVGGSYLPEDTESAIRDEENIMLLNNAKTLGIDTSVHQPVGHWTGFRPKRPSVCCDLDIHDGFPVAHNYGHGGSGWTINVGAARHCVDGLTRFLS